MTTIRAATVRDLPWVLRCERAYMEEIEPASLAGWTKAIDRNLQLWIDSLDRTFVAVVDDEAVGYGMWLMENEVATLISIHVMAERRGSGLGRVLLDQFAADAATAGAQSLELGLHSSNPAKRLYEAAGYEHVGVDGDYLLFQLVLA